MAYCDLVSTFPWAPVTPSMHKIYAHAAESIEENDNFSLGQLSEGPLEAQHKNLRRISAQNARTTSVKDNLVDTFNKMWYRSDYVIRSHRPQVCERVSEISFNFEDDILVKRFFV
jgi:hypothetical protein